MTTIDKSVSRSCPGVTNDDGRELTVRLHEEDGGTLTLKWKGLRKTEEIDVSLADLMDFAENGVPGVEQSVLDEASPGTHVKEASPGTAPKGTDKSEWCKFEDLLSRAHTIGDLDMSTRLILITMIKELRAHHAWLAKGSTGSWETFKAQHLALAKHL